LPGSLSSVDGDSTYVRVQVLTNPDLSRGLMAAAGVRASRFLDMDFRPGV